MFGPVAMYCVSGLMFVSGVRNRHGHGKSHLSRQNAPGGHGWETFCWQLLGLVSLLR